MMQRFQRRLYLLSVLIFLLAGCSAGLSGLQVTYLAPEGMSGDIWIAQGDEARQVTVTGGQVYDYSISANGQYFLYSQYNQAGGLDLWRVSREGKEPLRLLDCGADWCYQAVLSGDENTLAYSRSEYSQASLKNVSPRIWTLDLRAGTTAPLYKDRTPGEHPSWSPEGSRLAFYDPAAYGIRVLDMADGQSQFIETGYSLWSWSPDGKRIAFIDLLTLGNGEDSAHIYVAEIETRVVTRLDNIETAQTDYGAPVWSPDGEWLAVGWRYAGGAPGKHLKLVNVESGEEREVVQDYLYSQSSPRWSPDGAWIVFQRARLGDSQAQPELWAWEFASGELTLLAQNAALPQILP